MRNAWPCTIRKMANTSCVDSEVLYKKLGEVKASKKTKASKITLFIDENFYNDAVKWLETRDEDSKGRTNLTSQDVAIIQRKGWKLEVGKILSKHGKEIVQKCQLHQVLCQAYSNIAHKGRDKMDKYIKRNKEEEEPAPKRACYSLIKLTKKIRTTRQEKARNTQRKYKNKIESKQTQY